MADQAVLEERIEHLQKDVSQIQQDVRRLDGRMNEMQKEMLVSFGRLDARMNEMIGSLGSKLSDSHLSLIKWMVGTVIGGMGAATGITLAVVRFLQPSG